MKKMSLIELIEAHCINSICYGVYHSSLGQSGLFFDTKEEASAALSALRAGTFLGNEWGMGVVEWYIFGTNGQIDWFGKALGLGDVE